MVLVEAGPEIGVGRRDLHEVAAAPRPAQRDRRLREQGVDVERLVRLAGAALLRLLDQPDDRREARGELLLLREVGGGGLRQGQGAQQGDQDRDELPGAHSRQAT